MLHLRSIPPITSTGNKRRKTPARLDGLAHMSLGKYMSERKNCSFGMGNMKRDLTNTWDVHKYICNKKEERKPAKIVYCEQKIECVVNVIKNFNNGESFIVTLEFKELKFLSNIFIRSNKNYGNNSCVYFISVSYKEKELYLILSTIEDILEFEIVPQKKGINQIFSNEIYISELITIYDPLSMEIMQKDNIITINYKKLIR